MSVRNAAVNKVPCLLLVIGGLALSAAPPALAQSACTTNYCIRSQPISYQTPPGWPAVPVEPCCKTDWGSLPGGIDWSNGAPIMICTGGGDYATVYPNCGEPNNLSAAFPLAYEKPKIGIGVAWPNSKDYRYEVQPFRSSPGPMAPARSIPIIPARSRIGGCMSSSSPGAAPTCSRRS